MPSEREKMERWSLSQLFDTIANHEASSFRHMSARAELMRREQLQNNRVAEAQIKAAEATIKTAEYTRLSAHYMLYSVWAILFASGVTAIISILAWWFPRH